MKKLRFLSKGIPLIFSSFFKTEKNLRRVSRIAGISLILLSIAFTQSCNYLMVRSTDYPPASVVQEQIDQNKSIIIHTKRAVFNIEKPSAKNDSISGNYAMMYQMPSKRGTFPEVNSNMRYKKVEDSKLLDEVHIYVPYDVFSTEYNSYPIKDIYRFDIYQKNKELSTVTHIFGAIGIAAGLLIAIPIIVGLIGLLTGSCPYVYVSDGTDYILTGDIYSGAIYAPLERNDYLKLPRLVAADGKYKLKISNELKETQYNNLAELIVVDHPANTSVLVDKNGEYQSVSHLQRPITAVNSLGFNLNEILANKDSLVYIGPVTPGEIPAIDHIELSFDVPANATTAKLVINAKNSEWLEYMYQNIGDLMGSYGSKWREKQNHSEKDKLIKAMLAQKLPLSIYIEKNGEWVFCDYYNMTGPLMMRDDVISIGLNEFTERPLKIKLEAGSFFWQLDYVALDATINTQVNIRHIAADEAVTESEKLVTDLLRYDDMKYYVQEKEFESAELTFQVPENKMENRTVFLHSKGYYQQNYEGEGLPHISKLKKLQKPGQFPEFSKQLLYSEIEKITGKPVSVK